MIYIAGALDCLDIYGLGLYEMDYYVAEISIRIRCSFI